MINLKCAAKLLLCTQTTFFISALTIFASLNTAQAASNLGGGGLGFSCDVNTQQCECSGVETGADCQAMKKNCVSGTNLNCFKNIRNDPICICSMSLKKKKAPINIAPELNQGLAPQ